MEFYYRTIISDHHWFLDDNCIECEKLSPLKQLYSCLLVYSRKTIKIFELI